MRSSGQYGQSVSMEALPFRRTQMGIINAHEVRWWVLERWIPRRVSTSTYEVVFHENKANRDREAIIPQKLVSTRTAFDLVVDVGDGTEPGDVVSATGEPDVAVS